MEFLDEFLHAIEYPAIADKTVKNAKSWIEDGRAVFELTFTDETKLYLPMSARAEDVGAKFRSRGRSDRDVGIAERVILRVVGHCVREGQLWQDVPLLREGVWPFCQLRSLLNGSGALAGTCSPSAIRNSLPTVMM